MSGQILKRKLIINLPIEAVLNKKKYIVIKHDKETETELPFCSTEIKDGQWEYSLPTNLKAKNIKEIQFNKTPHYTRTIKVQCQC